MLDLKVLSVIQELVLLSSSLLAFRCMKRANRVAFVSMWVFFICCFTVFAVGDPFLPLILLFGCFLHSLGERLWSMIEGLIIYGPSHFFALYLLDLYWLWTLPHVGCFNFHVNLECSSTFPPKLSYYKLLLSSRCSISVIRAVLAYDCSWLSSAACITNIESVLAAYSSCQSACMYKFFSSCKSSCSSFRSFCLIDHMSTVLYHLMHSAIPWLSNEQII